MHLQIKVKKDSVITIVLICCLLNLASMDYIGGNTLALLNNMIRVVAAICALLLYFVRRRDKVSGIVLLIIVMQIWILISTIINNGSILNCALNVASIMALMLVFESMLSNTKSFINGFMVLGELVTYLNLATLIFYPDGMYRNIKEAYTWSTKMNWLLGNKNNFTPYLLVFCIVAFLYRCYGGSIWREWGIYICSFVSVLLARSSASIIGFVLLPFFFIAVKANKIRFNPYVLTIINIALFLGIIVFRVQNVVSPIIEMLLNRNASFTGRTRLWESVLQLIKERPLLGYGLQKNGYLNNLTGIDFGMHAHNIVLQYLFEGGIVYFVLYLAMLFVLFRHLHKFQHCLEAQCIIIAIFLFHVMGLMEPYRNPFIYVMYFFAYHIQSFIPKNTDIRGKMYDCTNS